MSAKKKDGLMICFVFISIMADLACYWEVAEKRKRFYSMLLLLNMHGEQSHVVFTKYLTPH